MQVLHGYINLVKVPTADSIVDIVDILSQVVVGAAFTHTADVILGRSDQISNLLCLHYYCSRPLIVESVINN